jgi:hypothetical protein
LAEADKAKIKYDDEMLETSKPMINNVLKALIARDIYENAAYYEISNTTNSIFIKGVEVAKSIDPVNIMNHF